MSVNISICANYVWILPHQYSDLESNFISRDINHRRSIHNNCGMNLSAKWNICSVFLFCVFLPFCGAKIWICEIKDQHKSWLSANKATNAVVSWIQTFGRKSWNKVLAGTKSDSNASAGIIEVKNFTKSGQNSKLCILFLLPHCWYVAVDSVVNWCQKTKELKQSFSKNKKR